MKQYESEHYIFNYGENTKAAQDIVEIAKLQEDCFRYICSVLRVKPDFKIEYFLCDSPEEVGRIYGDNEPCNALLLGRIPFTLYIMRKYNVSASMKMPISLATQ